MDLSNNTLAHEVDYAVSSRPNELRSAPPVSSTMSPLPPPVPQIEPVPNKKMSRKRTKTGCLTCRKRRIKCGEERPICNNCVKSKRHCDGYNQRVIFKAPAVDWRSAQQSSASNLQYHSGMIPGRSEYDLAQQTSGALASAPLTPLRPRPSLDFCAINEQVITTAPSSAGLERTSLQFSDPYMPRPSMPAPSTYTQSVPHTTSASFSSLPSLPPLYYTQPIQASHSVTTSAEQPIGFRIPIYAQDEVSVSLSPRGTSIYAEEQRTPSSGTTISTFSPGLHSPFMSHQPQMQHANYRSFSTVDRRSPMGMHEKARIYNNARHRSLNHFDFKTSPWPLSATDTSHFMSPVDSQPEERPVTSSEGTARPADYHLPSEISKEENAFENQTLYNIAPIDSLERQNVSPTQLLHKAAVEYEDDDYYDVDSTDDLDVERMSAMDEGTNKLSLMRSIHHAAGGGVNVRSYDTFLYEGILDHYRPETVASPLKNPRTARVFAHFIHATGPSLSIFERNPRSSSAMFSGGSVPASQQSLWTYTLPMLALRHQGLLHAMLALASLHIAKIKGASATPSFRHYAFALKRIHHCVGHPKKRLLIATIAATLLLGFYEVLTADHTKWSSHLLGAKQLFTEIDYAGMAKDYMKVKAEQAAIDSAALATANFGEEKAGNYKHMSFQPMKPAHPYANDHNSMIDERLVSTIVGRQVSYNDFGRVLGDTGRKDSHHPSSKPFDASRFEVLQDLFWWYCKQDAYHSILSGDPLLLDFQKWSECPPRCALGKNEGTYGTLDHLTLLLGRVGDFASRDRKRKVKAVQLNGGVWKPPGSTANVANTGVAPDVDVGGSVSQQKFPSVGPTSAPFYGMAPAGRSRMPSSYGVDPTRSPSESPVREEFDLTPSTESAIQEWEQIRVALDVFASSLGPSYQPLPPEYTTPVQTPFGDAIQYRSYDIGVLWAIFNMTKLILIRSHPHMPPAATMAAGVAAQQTAWIANTIGRIAAGIVPTSMDEPISPVLGSALVDSTMPLFFAGVQLIDPTQRAWLVSRVRKIEERTSWASIGVIASGCETAWVKAAEAGRGPPYERVRDTKHTDERVSGIVSEDGGPQLGDAVDRRFVHLNSGTRAHFAIGIIGEEEDVRA